MIDTSVQRVKISQIIESQLPDFVVDENPLFVDFLKQYYISQEYQGGVLDIADNIDKYLKLDSFRGDTLVKSTELTSDTESYTTTINVSSTNGWPKSYGLLKINDEIITYTGITTNSFTGCIRGFSGVDAIKKTNQPEILSFSITNAQTHSSGDTVSNLSNLFLIEFLDKIKQTFSFGFEKRTLFENLDQVQFIRQVKDFYKSKGTDASYKILFKVLFGEDVKIIRPNEFVIKPSDADYTSSCDMAVKAVSGDPRYLKGSTLYQDKDSFDKNISGASAGVSDVSEFRVDGETYYSLSLSKDTIDGNFSTPSFTRIVDRVSIGNTVLSVDSTVGFPTTGFLSLVKSGRIGIVSYTGKNTTQFLNVSGINTQYNFGDEVRYNNVSYGYSGSSLVNVFITGVISDVNSFDNTKYLSENDNIFVGSGGITPNENLSKHNSWLYNLPLRYSVEEVYEEAPNIYKISLYTLHDYRISDEIELLNSNYEVLYDAVVSQVKNETEIIVENIDILDAGLIKFTRRKLLKANSLKYPYINDYSCNVQNTYSRSSDRIENPFVYVASPSLPKYEINASLRSVTWTGASSGDSIQITEGNKDHGYITGSKVQYTSISGAFGSLISGKNYFITRVNSNVVKFSNSLSDLNRQIYIDCAGSGTGKLELSTLANKPISHQKQLKRIPINPKVSTGNQIEYGPVGIFVNGVEIQSYKSEDVFYYGSIERINVTNGGENYDVVNPPNVIIESISGSGSTAYCNVKGSFERIDIIDPGFDYIDNPSIQISGGNGKNAKASVNLRTVTHYADFDASSSGSSINTSNDTIGFTTYHKFRNGEAVIYKTFGSTAIGIGTTSSDSTRKKDLVNNSTYYVYKVNANVIKLSNTPDGAATGQNIVNITAFGDGIQRFEAVTKKKIIGSILVENPGENYENKRITVFPEFVNIFNDSFYYQNHNFQHGELVQYRFDGISIGGLSTSQNYYLIKIDNDNFRLAEAGVTTAISKTNFETNTYIGITSTGSGKHIFKYPDIQVSVNGTIGIGTTSNENYKASINPVVRGTITSIDVEDGGVGYGSSTIVNFNIPPEVRVSSGSTSEFTVLVSDLGKVEEVIVTKSGTGYVSSPDIVIDGDGIGAKAIAVVEDGQISRVRVLNGGVGYSTSKSFANEVFPGNGFRYSVDIKKWQINDVERYKEINESDDGFLIPGYDDKTIKFTSHFAPRELRKILFQKTSEGIEDFSKPDLSIVDGIEENILPKHSPILGWAYDGSPIYGPYGYENKNGTGGVKLLTSGYQLKNSRLNGPPTSVYPLGYFIDDYEFLNNGDLDENNGRFCVTPDYPDGVYAYFCVVNPSSIETTGSFKNFRRPIFPYVIGNSFTHAPDTWNFINENNQDLDLNYEVESGKIFRNTYPYKLRDPYVAYDGLFDSTDFIPQENKIDFTTKGFINSYKIENDGDLYQVNEQLEIDETNSGGVGFSAKVSEVKGKNVTSIATTSLTISSNILLYNKVDSSVVVYSPYEHNLNPKDVVTFSGISTDALKLNGQYPVGITSFKCSLVNSMPTLGIAVSYAHLSSINNIQVHDVIQIDSEKMLVLNIDRVNNRVRVKRNYSGIASSHSEYSTVNLVQNRFVISSGISTDIITNRNLPYYFNPSESVAIGNTGTYQISYTYEVPGGGFDNKAIPIKRIYLPNHGFQTNQILKYRHDGTSISFSHNGSSSFTLANDSTVYAVRESDDLIGLSLNKVGISSLGVIYGLGTSNKDMFFLGVGAGTTHSLTPQETQVTGTVNKIITTVTCDESHNLAYGDVINFDVNPGIITSVVVKYDETSRKIIVNPKSASINTTTDEITVSDHGYQTGDKVLYTASSSASPLSSSESYYVIRVDKDKFKLSNTYYDATKEIPTSINITTAGTANVISSINPQINVVRGNTISFDLSDSSLSQPISGIPSKIYDFVIYKDRNFTVPYYSDEDGYEIQTNGTIGVSTNATVNLTTTEKTPNQLYYKLVPQKLNLILSKKIPVIDEDVLSYSTINMVTSSYNGTYSISGVTSESFDINLSNIPEKSSYSSSDAQIEYSTSSTRAFGPIKRISITNRGRGYKSLPSVVSVASTFGSGAIINLESDNIGIVKRASLKNIGFGYPTDRTIRPIAVMPQVLKIRENSTLDSIGINSGGKYYISPPNLLVIDSVTQQVKNVLTEVQLQGTGISNVEILQTVKDLSNVPPRVIPINNSNGVGINSASFDASTKIVTLVLDKVFDTSTFPFFVGQQVYVENIGIASTGSGYNSSDYDYSYFSVTGVTTTPPSGNSLVQYRLKSSVTYAGISSVYSSSAQPSSIIPVSYLPSFNPILSTNVFEKGEEIVSGQKVGTVLSWDIYNKTLKVSSSDTFNAEDIIKGSTSQSTGTIESTISFVNSFEVKPFSTVIKGWQKSTGKLNNSLQKIQDSDYYQLFSYSIDSAVSYEDWKDSVNSLAHVVGFKKFADLEIVSEV